jgi:hypothetical protein
MPYDRLRDVLEEYVDRENQRIEDTVSEYLRVDPTRQHIPFLRFQVFVEVTILQDLIDLLNGEKI